MNADLYVRRAVPVTRPGREHHITGNSRDRVAITAIQNSDDSLACTIAIEAAYPSSVTTVVSMRVDDLAAIGFAIGQALDEIHDYQKEAT